MIRNSLHLHRRKYHLPRDLAFTTEAKESGMTSTSITAILPLQEDLQAEFVAIKTMLDEDEILFRVENLVFDLCSGGNEAVIEHSTETETRILLAYRNALGVPQVACVIDNSITARHEHYATYARIMAVGNNVFAEPGVLYIIHCNRNYEEWSVVAYSPKEARQKVYEMMRLYEFDGDDHVTAEDVATGSPRFWTLVSDAFEEQEWLGFTINTFDPKTHKLSVYYQ